MGPTDQQINSRFLENVVFWQVLFHCRCRGCPLPVEACVRDLCCLALGRSFLDDYRYDTQSFQHSCMSHCVCLSTSLSGLR
jgi:hypothetical protein